MRRPQWRQLDQRVTLAVEARVGPLAHLILVSEQHDLPLAGQPVQQLEQAPGALGIGVHRHVVEQQRAGVMAFGEPRREGHPQQQVDLLGSAMAEQLGAPEIALRPAHLHRERRRIHADVDVALVGHPGQPLAQQLGQLRHDLAMDALLRPAQEVDRVPERLVQLPYPRQLSLRRCQRLLRLSPRRQRAHPLGQDRLGPTRPKRRLVVTTTRTGRECLTLGQLEPKLRHAR